MKGRVIALLLTPPLAAHPNALLMNSGGGISPLISAMSFKSSFLYRYRPKACCLPHGGLSNPPSPPAGSECPSFGWYWGGSFNCCVPSHPSPPPPQCPPGWEWIPGNYKCQPVPTGLNQQPPQPSRHSGHNWKRRNQKVRANSLCPNDLTACPVVGTHRLFSDYECIDAKHDLQSCGGCSSIGAGQDCTAIGGAWNVGCEAGHCTGVLHI
jgi:hypothetical protein